MFWKLTVKVPPSYSSCLHLVCVQSCRLVYDCSFTAFYSHLPERLNRRRAFELDPEAESILDFKKFHLCKGTEDGSSLQDWARHYWRTMCYIYETKELTVHSVFAMAMTHNCMVLLLIPPLKASTEWSCFVRSLVICRISTEETVTQSVGEGDS